MRVSLLVLASIGLVQPVTADNWAHWRGPTGNGVSLTAKPPTEWSLQKNVRWKTPIPGRGSGSPIIWENQIFVVSAVPSSSSSKKLDFTLFSFDRKSGQLQWSQTAVSAVPHEGTHSTNGYASASPCTDGKHVYAHFGSQGLYAYSLSGDLAWKRNDFPPMRTRASFGEGSSPTLAGELLILPWDHEGQSYLYALNKTTGETVWQTPRDEPTCWATPLIVEHDGQSQIVMNGQNNARAYDLKTGKELWRCPGQTQRPVASPVKSGSMVLVGSGFRGSYLGAFQLGGSGDIEGSSNVVWSVQRDTPDITSLLLSDNRLYYCKGKSGILTCADVKTGKPFFASVRQQGLGSQLYASPIAAGGHVYFTDRQGNTVVIKDSEKYEAVAVNSLGETIDATPAPVDDELIIRGEDHLFCIGE